MKLLLAIDDSQPATAAVHEVARRPWPDGTCVRVLSVMIEDPASPLPGVPVPSAPLGEVAPWPAGTLQTWPKLREKRRRIIDEASRLLTECSLPAEARVREGAAGPEIVQEAHEWGAQLIVLGSRNLGPVKRLLLGSVANYVLNHARCSVEIVREPLAQ